jgi:hypothetical protein
MRRINGLFLCDPGGTFIGATPNPLKGGNAILKDLLSGYRGDLSR